MTYRTSQRKLDYINRVGNYSDRIHPARGLMENVASRLEIKDGWTLEELENAQQDQLKRLIEIDKKLVDINNQIAFAMAKQNETGEYSDANWWARVNAAKRHEGRNRQSIQVGLSEIKRRIKDIHRQNSKEQSKDFDRAFKNAAKRILDEYTYDKIVAAAERAIST